MKDWQSSRNTLAVVNGHGESTSCGIALMSAIEIAILAIRYVERTIVVDSSKMISSEGLGM